MYLRVGHVRQITVVNEELVHLLGSVPVFAELPMTAIERVAAGLVAVSAPAGTALMTQGEPGDTFVVIATGEIEVTVDGRPIHRLGPGAGVGEIALLRRSPRTATVVAITDVTAWSVDAGTFLAAVAGPAAAAVTERMAEAEPGPGRGAGLRIGQPAIRPVRRSVRRASASTSRIPSPYFSSLAGPMPLTRRSPARVVGRASAMAARVESWAITYAGHALVPGGRRPPLAERGEHRIARRRPASGGAGRRAGHRGRGPGARRRPRPMRGRRSSRNRLGWRRPSRPRVSRRSAHDSARWTRARVIPT